MVYIKHQSCFFFFCSFFKIGEFAGHEDEWIVIQGGIVLKMTPDENEALAFIDRSPGMFVLYQVNHEEEVIEIDAVDCQIFASCKKDTRSDRHANSQLTHAGGGTQ